MPFNASLAGATVSEARKHVPFLSTQAFWKDLPKFPQPLKAIDLNATLDSIDEKVQLGQYNNDYEFDRDLAYLFDSYHDSHVSWRQTCFTYFIFAHDFPLLSVSTDADTEPKIYLAKAKNQEVRLKRGRVLQINGQDAVTFLTDFIRDFPANPWIDLDARWNQLFARRILLGTQGVDEAWRGTFAQRWSFDPACLVLSLEDGSEEIVEWFADINIKALETREIPFTDSASFAESCLNAGVFREDTASASASTTAISASPTPSTATAMQTSQVTTPPNFPTAVSALPFNEVAFHNLDPKVAVLSVRSFDKSGFNSVDTLTYIAQFLGFINGTVQEAKANGCEKLIIDVSGNLGGISVLGHFLINVFIPEAQPFYGFNARNHRALQKIVEAVNSAPATDLPPDLQVFGNYVQSLMANTKYGTLSTSALLKPTKLSGDFFTAMARSKLGDPRRLGYIESFAAKDIIILSDGLCASSCSIFVEAMSEYGIKNVVYGGRPQKGPMQVSGGVKGQVPVSVFPSFPLSHSPHPHHSRRLPRWLLFSANQPGLTLEWNNSATGSSKKPSRCSVPTHPSPPLSPGKKPNPSPDTCPMPSPAGLIR